MEIRPKREAWAPSFLELAIWRSEQFVRSENKRMRPYVFDDALGTTAPFPQVASKLTPPGIRAFRVKNLPPFSHGVRPFRRRHGFLD